MLVKVHPIPGSLSRSLPSSYPLYSGQRAPLKQQRGGRLDSAPRAVDKQLQVTANTNLWPKTRASAHDAEVVQASIPYTVLCEDISQPSASKEKSELPKNKHAPSSTQLVYTSNYSTSGNFHLVESHCYHCGISLHSSSLVGFF